MTAMQVIIPMAGAGRRMGPLTRHKPKALLRLADKRLLDQVLSIFQQLENAHALEYIFIIGDLGEQIKEHMRAVYPGKRVRYYTQEPLLGQSHAVHLAREAISGPIFLTYCDTLNETDFSFLSLKTVDGMASVQDVDDPRRHGVAAMGPDNLITKLIEKPDTLEHKTVLTGLYYFSEGRELIKAIERQMRRGTSLNNEYYLADAINILLGDGMRLGAEKVLQWHDAGTPAAILETNAYLLHRHSASRNGSTRAGSNVFIPPVYIHESSRVESSRIGPDVSIGENCVIDRSIIKNAIVDDNSRVTEVTLVNSLVGEGCAVTGDLTQSTVGEYGGVRIYCAADEPNGGNPAQGS